MTEDVPATLSTLPLMPFPALGFVLPALEAAQAQAVADGSRPILGLAIGGQYQKQSLHNRYWIIGAQGPARLTIPVRHVAPGTLLTEVLIDERQAWARAHLRTLATCYGRAPFYEHLMAPLADLFNHPPAFLWEFSWQAATIWTRFLPGRPAPTALSTHDDQPAVAGSPPGLPVGFSYHTVFGYAPQAHVSVLDVLFCTGGRWV